MGPLQLTSKMFVPVVVIAFVALNSVSATHPKFFLFAGQSPDNETVVAKDNSLSLFFRKLMNVAVNIPFLGVRVNVDKGPDSKTSVSVGGRDGVNVNVNKSDGSDKVSVGESEGVNVDVHKEHGSKTVSVLAPFVRVNVNDGGVTGTSSKEEDHIVNKEA